MDENGEDSEVEVRLVEAGKQGKRLQDRFSHIQVIDQHVGAVILMIL